jgi:hypothetical protein
VSAISDKLAHLSKTVKIVAELLRANGDESMADELSRLCDIAVDEKAEFNDRREAINQIVFYCHIKCLGDMYIRDISWQEWFKVIDRLQKAAQKCKNLS